MVASSRRQSHDMQLWSGLSLLSNQISQALDRKLTRRHGLGLTDFMTLRTLAESASDAVRMQELADGIGINQSTLSRVASRLERSDLVARRVSETDRRGTYIALTDTGRTVLEESTATFLDELTVAFEMAALNPRLGGFLARMRDADLD